MNTYYKEINFNTSEIQNELDKYLEEIISKNPDNIDLNDKSKQYTVYAYIGHQENDIKNRGIIRLVAQVSKIY